MGISDYLRAKLSGLPGIEEATTELVAGEQVIRINGVEAHAGPFASDTEIEKAIRSVLNMPGPDATEPTEPTEPNVTPMPSVALIEEPKMATPAIEAPALLPAPTTAKPVAPIAKNRTGAGYFASLIRQQQAAFKEQFAKAGEEMKSALDEMKELADAATQEAKHVKAEAADLRAALGLNSNGDDE